MRDFIGYMTYLVKHKYGVARRLVYQGMYLEAITHDLSKLLPDELFPYVKYTQSKDKKALPKEDRDAFFEAVTLHHLRNPHHWRHWVIDGEGNDLPEPRDMPLNYIIEMICDWQTVSSYYGNSACDWYEDQVKKGRILLSPKTKEVLEFLLYQEYLWLDP